MKKQSFDLQTYLTKQHCQSSERLTAHQYERTIQDLMEKIDILESKLKQSNQAKFQIVTSHKQLEDECNSLQCEFQKQNKEQNRLVSINNTFSSQVKALQEEIASLKEKYKTKFEIINREMLQKEAEAHRLSMEMKDKEEKLTLLQVTNSMSLQSSDNSKEESERQKAINRTQAAKINELEKTINDLYINKKSEGNLLLENEHLRSDNIRMLQMLKTTSEYKDFAFLNETTPGGIRYVHDEVSKKVSHHSCNIAKSEANHKLFCDNWIPGEAFDLVMSYSKKYELDLNEKVINDLLVSLNTIWRRKEQQVIVKLKAKYQRDINDLKRKHGIGMEIEKDPQSPNLLIAKKAPSNSMQKPSSKGKELVVNAMKVAESFNSTKKALEKEINALKVKLTERDYQLHSKESRDKGDSLGIINRTLGEIDKMMSFYNDLLSQYNERVKDTKIPSHTLEEANHNIKMIHNTVQWFFTAFREGIDNIHFELAQWQKELSHQFI